MQCVPVTVEQICLTLQRLKHLVLTLTTEKRYALATFQRPDGDFGLVEIPRQYPIVVGDATHLAERALGFGVQLVGVDNVGNLRMVNCAVSPNRSRTVQ